jgi:nitrite reductase/ring-hydroxylating ferredoxin subunit
MSRQRMLTNHNTQPIRGHKVFNNWDVVSEGWYIVMPSTKLKKLGVLSQLICSQQLVFYRSEEGIVFALDGFCPHMGVDLGIGKVIGEHLRCFFHHWKFNGQGQCVEIPCQKEIPAKTKLKAYPVREQFGFIWVHPSAENASSFMSIPELEGKETIYVADPPYTRSCHHHITMINGIDPQHLKTVHQLNIEMDLKIQEHKKGHLDIELSGMVPRGNLKEKLMALILGEKYSYSMHYADGCVAGLTLMKGVKLFNRYNIMPTLHMIFAYRPEGDKTLVWPIYITHKRKGLKGLIVNRLCLFLTRMAFKSLQGEDGEVYENIRFNPENLLPIDEPVARYIGYINRLRPSVWSKNKGHDPDVDAL